MITKLPATGFMRLAQILSVYPVSKSHWWSGVKSGRLPRAYKLSENITAWRTEDILELIQKSGEKA